MGLKSQSLCLVPLLFPCWQKGLDPVAGAVAAGSQHGATRACCPPARATGTGEHRAHLHLAHPAAASIPSCGRPAPAGLRTISEGNWPRCSQRRCPRLMGRLGSQKHPSFVTPQPPRLGAATVITLHQHKQRDVLPPDKTSRRLWHFAKQEENLKASFPFSFKGNKNESTRCTKKLSYACACLPTAASGTHRCLSSRTLQLQAVKPQAGLGYQS